MHRWYKVHTKGEQEVFQCVGKCIQRHKVVSQNIDHYYANGVKLKAKWRLYVNSRAVRRAVIISPNSPTCLFSTNSFNFIVATPKNEIQAS